jgi:putative transposase
VIRRTVAELMAADGLAGRAKERRWASDPPGTATRCRSRIWSAGTSPAPAPDVKWCGDLTEIPTLEGMLYLASVEDLCSRRPLGFVMSEHPDAVLARTCSG